MLSIWVISLPSHTHTLTFTSIYLYVNIWISLDCPGKTCFLTGLCIYFNPWKDKDQEQFTKQLLYYLASFAGGIPVSTLLHFLRYCWLSISLCSSWKATQLLCLLTQKKKKHSCYAERYRDSCIMNCTEYSILHCYTANMLR